MQAIIWIIGALVIVEGIAFMIQPGLFSKVLLFFAKGKMIYTAAAVRFMLGPIFLIYAGQCKMAWVIIAVGVAMLAGGAVLLLMKIEKVRKMLQWWAKRPEWMIRTIAAVPLLLGTLIVIAGLPKV